MFDHLQFVNFQHHEIVQNVVPAATGRKWKLYDPHVVFGVTVDTGVIRRCERMVECDNMVGLVAQGRIGFDFVGVSLFLGRRWASWAQGAD